MTRLNWNAVGSRNYTAGVDRGVFYPENSPGVNWDGLISVQESSSGSDISTAYVDGVKYRNKNRSGSFSATIEAYTYPEEFEEYDQPPRKSFGFSYRTKVGNDVKGLEYAYQIHLVYNALATPTSSDYETVGDNLDAMNFSWDISTTPLVIEGIRPSAHLIVDTSIAYPWLVKDLEDILYGSESTPPRLPMPDELLTLFENASILLIVDHGDGTWTASGPDDVVSMIDATTFQINWPSANYISDVAYTLKSL